MSTYFIAALSVLCTAQLIAIIYQQATIFKLRCWNKKLVEVYKYREVPEIQATTKSSRA